MRRLSAPARRTARLCLPPAAAVLLQLAAGCGGVPEVERDPVPLLQTSSLHYELERLEFGWASTIPWVFRNETGHDVFVRNCEGDARPLLQVRRPDGRWVDAWAPFGRACESRPIVVPAGGTWSDTLRVLGGPPGSNVRPTFVFEDVAGVYRLVWDRTMASWDPDDPSRARPLPLEQTVSNAFVLEPS